METILIIIFQFHTFGFILKIKKEQKYWKIKDEQESGDWGLNNLNSNVSWSCSFTL